MKFPQQTRTLKEKGKGKEQVKDAIKEAQKQQQQQQMPTSGIMENITFQGQKVKRKDKEKGKRKADEKEVRVALATREEGSMDDLQENTSLLGGSSGNGNGNGNGPILRGEILDVCGHYLSAIYGYLYI